MGNMIFSPAPPARREFLHFQSLDGLGDLVITGDGSATLRHPDHGECYHSVVGALAEATELYCRASGLPQAWTGPAPVRVLDVGLGLGYNALATLQSWWASREPVELAMTSLEVNQELVRALASGTASWQGEWVPAARSVCQDLQLGADGVWRAPLRHPSGVTGSWVVHLGDATARPVPRVAGGAGYTYVWQDPFSPQRNPSMWSAEWFQRVAEVAADEGARLMTYSVARSVRDALTTAGWQWRKLTPTLPGKRAWLMAERLPRR